MFLEQRAAFFSFFLKGTRRRKRELERKQFLYLKKYCTDTFAESRHKLYVTKYHPLKQ